MTTTDLWSAAQANSVGGSAWPLRMGVAVAVWIGPVKVIVSDVRGEMVGVRFISARELRKGAAPAG